VADGGGLVEMVNSRLTDDSFREQIRTLHASGAPLVDMVEALGLTDKMSGEIRATLGGLGKEQVEGIRAATLEMLDRHENKMPLDCDVPDKATNVSVAVVDKSGKRTIQVRAT
jgi:hypothetical protein